MTSVTNLSIIILYGWLLNWSTYFAVKSKDYIQSIDDFGYFFCDIVIFRQKYFYNSISFGKYSDFIQACYIQELYFYFSFDQKANDVIRKKLKIVLSISLYVFCKIMHNVVAMVLAACFKHLI
jgi:hypothetical protein